MLTFRLSIRRWSLAVGITILGLAPVPILLAQTTNTGSIVGTVVDPSDQVVPHANITLSNEATGAKRTSSRGMA